MIGTRYFHVRIFLRSLNQLPAEPCFPCEGLSGTEPTLTARATCAAPIQGPSLRPCPGAPVQALEISGELFVHSFCAFMSQMR